MVADTQPQPARIRPKRSLYKQAASQLLVLTAATAVALTVCAFLVAGSLLQNRVFAQLSSLIVAKSERIENRLQTDRERTALLGTRSEVRSANSSEVQEIFADLQRENVPIVGISIALHSGAKYVHGESVEDIAITPNFTTIVPLITEKGWIGHTVYAPIIDPATDKVLGTVAARYSVKSLLDSVLDVSSLGQTAEVLLGIEQGGNVALLNQRYAEGPEGVLVLGSMEQELQYGSPVAEALEGVSDMRRTEDYAGNTVLAAYAPLSTLNWALVVKVHTSEALKGVTILAIALSGISAILLILAALLARILARHLTAPILRLSERVSELGPGNWLMQRSVSSHDEVEYLETKVMDMAERLKKVYENLEGEVQKRTQELRNQYEKDRIILETIDHGVLLIDADGNVKEANPAAVRVLKCEGNVCSGRKITEVFELYANHKKMIEDHPVLQTLSDKNAMRPLPDVRYSVMRSDSILIPISLTVQPLMQDGQLVGAIAVFQDVTEERRVDYMKSEFISLASHQLRTPLSTLEWYIELLGGEGELNDAQKEYLHEMTIASKRMVNLIDALLHAAKLEGRTIEPHEQEVNLSELMQDLAEELQSLAKDKGIACSIDIPREKLLITTDSVLLHVVFKNLFSNAVKYTKPKGTVGVRMISEGGKAVISVTDSGVGIPEKEQKRIFERLFRAENVRKMDTDGNGLGLYISRMITENLGGKIRFESTEGKGSTFTVEVPIAKK